MAAQFFDETAIYKQMRDLGVKKLPSRLTLNDWIRRDLVPRPLLVGHQHEYPADFVPRLYAGMSLLLAGGWQMSKALIHYISEIALTIESCGSPQDVLAIARGLARGRGG